MREHGGVIKRATKPEQHAGDAEDEAEITDTIDQEGLHVGEYCARALVPESDQQIGDKTYRFPAEEQLQEVVAHHEHEHREREQRDVAEETLVTIIVGHVADCVDVHHQGDEGHYDHHHRGQTVNQKADVGARAADFKPGIDILIEGLRTAPDQLIEHIDRQYAAQAHTGNGHAVRGDAADALAEKAGNQRADQRGEDDRQQDGFVEHHQSTLELVDGGHVNRRAIAEQDNENGQTDRSLGGGNGQDEEDENLTGRITEVT